MTDKNAQLLAVAPGRDRGAVREAVEGFAHRCHGSGGRFYKLYYIAEIQNKTNE